MVKHGITLLIVVALLLAPATSSARHLCAGDAMPISECCCQHDDSADEPLAQDEARGICCALEAPDSTVTATPLVTLDDRAPTVEAPTRSSIEVAAPVASRIEDKGLAVPPGGPPLFAKNCRLLI